MLTNDSLLKTHIPTLISMWRKNKKQNPLSQKELAEVSAHLLALQRGLTGKRTLVGDGYMENSSKLGAYLLYYWPVSYMQIYWAAKNCPEIQNLGGREISILDLGCGPGPAATSLCDQLLQNASTKISVTLVDYSSKAVDLAAQFFSADLKSIPTEKIVCDFQKGFPPLKKKYDIIVMSHALNELWKKSPDANQRRLDFLLSLSKNLSDGGILFLVEPALLETSRNLLSLRDRLIQNGFSLVSPCQKQADCPALKAGPNHTCHAEINWKPLEPILSISKNAGLDRESVKMTYFIFKKSPMDQTVPTESGAIQTKNTVVAGKIVSDGMLNKSGRVRFLMCDGKKRIAISAKKDDPRAKEIGFFNLKRYDSICVTNPEIRGDKENQAFGINPDTNLTVIPFA